MSLRDSDEGTFARCVRHGDSMASFRCDGCDGLLCYDCVDEGRHLNRCRLCGEQAHGLEDTWRPSADDAAPEDLPAKDILYTAKAGAPAPVQLADDPLTQVFNHMVVPGATIAMVTSLLFFLLDVRSVFFPGSAHLKWLGFWFVMGTVLIARYGKAYGDKERVGCYSLGLAMATIVAIQLGPWQQNGPGWQGPLVNGLILLAVWRFATALTSGLALEGQDAAQRGQRLYGLERLAMESMLRHRKGARPSTRRRETAPSATAGTSLRGINLPSSDSPNRAVARLAAAVMVVFALGEPALLQGAPHIVARGFSAMVVFLLATGIVLGAASVVDVLRRVRKAGGRSSSTLLPRRMLAAAAVMFALLSIAVAMPGVHLDGSRAVGGRSPGESVDTASGDAEGREGGGDAAPGEARGGGSGDTSGDSPRQTAESAAPSDGGESPLAGGGMLINVLTTVGSWLRYPALIALLVLGVVALRRLLPLLGGWQGMFDRWRGFLARWTHFLRRRSKPRGGSKRTVDPWLGVEALGSLPPAQAVRRAYGHVLLMLDVLGYPRDSDKTPHEVLASLPKRFQSLRPDLTRLTELYVATEYGSGETAADAGRQAAEQVARLRRLAEALTTAP